MQTSIFLAKLMGPMLFAMGLFVVLRRERMRRVVREFLDSEALIFLSGVITLPVGIAIVISHNVWEANWRVLITLFGWIVILAGIARLAFPDLMKMVGNTMLEKGYFTTLPGAVMAVLGAFLSYQGYL
jgi:hypothetical protein